MNWVNSVRLTVICYKRLAELLRQIIEQNIHRRRDDAAHQQTLLQGIERMAQALDNLNANVVALTAAIDAELAKPPVVVGEDSAGVQAAADAVAVQTARLAPAAPTA